MIWSISWRNVWRNKLRSLVVIFAITLGVFAGIFTVALTLGLVEQRIATVIETESSHIQIHQEQFSKTSEMEYFMENSDDIIEKAQNTPGVIAASKRIVINSMAASAETATGVQIIGIVPENERQVTNLSDKLIDGAYFEGVKRNPVVIGKKLAEKLNVKVRSKIIITMQDMEGNIIGGAFRVNGIFETVNSMYDETNIFVHLSDLAKLSGLDESQTHEIAILLENNEILPTVQKELKSKIAGLEIMSWLEIMPEMAYMNEAMDLYLYIFMGIILLALGFGIVNTMLMVVLERIKELGMLLAIGMNRKRVFMMILLETVFLTLTGGVFGILIAMFVVDYFSTHAIDLSMYAEGFSKLGYETMIYTSIDTQSLISVVAMVLATGILASIYPAIRAIKNDPAEIIRIA